MSYLRILVCPLLVAVTTLTATTANADHQSLGGQNAGCGRSNRYPAMSGGYRQPVQPYGSGSRTYRVRQPQMNYGFGSEGYNRPSEYNSQYLPNRGYDRGVRPQYGGYGSNSSEMGYDRVHGDNHPLPRANSRQTLDFYRSGSEYSYDGRGFNENSGW